MKLMTAIRLALTADKILHDGKSLPAEHQNEFDQAADLIGQTRGTDVLSEICTLRRSGISLTVDLRPVWRDTGEKPPTRGRA